MKLPEITELGMYGMKRVTVAAGALTPTNGEFIGLQPIGGNCTLHADTVMYAGDEPDAADTFTQDVYYPLVFTTLRLATGVAYTWYTENNG